MAGRVRYELRRLPRTGLPVLTDEDGNVLPGQTQVTVNHTAKEPVTLSVTFLMTLQGFSKIPDGITSALDKEAKTA